MLTYPHLLKKKKKRKR